MTSLVFDRAFEPHYGEAITIAPGVRRLTARNPGVYTFTGTNTYLIGTLDLAVIDPGPRDDEHLQAVLKAAGEAPVSAIIITHGHADHSAGAAALRAATSAPVFAGLPKPSTGSAGQDPESAHSPVVPDRALSDALQISGAGWRLTAIATPGHASDHHVLALAGTDILFSGDHVMGWSTSIVAPPDGSMRDYMASLDKLQHRNERRYLPGHGGAIANAPAYVAGLVAHRRERERGIIARLQAGDTKIAAVVGNIYRDTDPRLHAAAALSVLAHLEALVAEGRVVTDGPPTLESEYRLA
jgi:glyoxylase-like metal-dependent hydrolase (beta-lactamase superfamily II)